MRFVSSVIVKPSDQIKLTRELLKTSYLRHDDNEAILCFASIVFIAEAIESPTIEHATYMRLSSQNHATRRMNRAHHK
jgi:hypothetical protein